MDTPATQLAFSVKVTAIGFRGGVKRGSHQPCIYLSAGMEICGNFPAILNPYKIGKNTQHFFKDN